MKRARAEPSEQEEHDDHPKNLSEADYVQIQEAWTHLAQIIDAHEVGHIGWLGKHQRHRPASLG